MNNNNNNNNNKKKKKKKKKKRKKKKKGRSNCEKPCVVSLYPFSSTSVCYTGMMCRERRLFDR